MTGRCILGEYEAASLRLTTGAGRASRMLILVRKVQQGIWIQGDIFVQVLSVDRDRVKLGITAPTDVKVMRQELLVADGDETGIARNGSAHVADAPASEARG